MRCESEFVCIPLDGRIDVDVAHLIAGIDLCGLDLDAGCIQGASKRSCAHAAASLGGISSANREVSGINQPPSGGTRCSCSGYFGVFCYLDIGCAGLNKTAVATARS